MQSVSASKIFTRTGQKKLFVRSWIFKISLGLLVHPSEQSDTLEGEPVPTLQKEKDLPTNIAETYCGFLKDVEDRYSPQTCDSWCVGVVWSPCKTSPTSLIQYFSSQILKKSLELDMPKQRQQCIVISLKLYMVPHQQFLLSLSAYAAV